MNVSNTNEDIYFLLQYQNCINGIITLDVQTIVKFAQLEFKHGEAERGRTILEGVMSNYPKRLDLWNVYLDMEIKADDIEMAR